MKNINTIPCCQAPEDSGKRGWSKRLTKKNGKTGVGCSLPLLSTLGFKEAKSCCRRPLQPSLHPDLSLSPFAWQVCLSTFFPTSPPFPVLVAWPGCQVTTHWDTSSSFPSVQDLGEPPFFSCQPQGTFLTCCQLLTVLQLLFLWQISFPYLWWTQRVLSSGLLPFSMKWLLYWVWTINLIQKFIGPVSFQGYFKFYNSMLYVITCACLSIIVVLGICAVESNCLRFYC